MAVWALRDLGVRCVIAPSFGDIFAGNCVQNGLLPITLDPSMIDSLADDAGGGDPFEVDLETSTIRTPTGRAVHFTVDPTRRARLLAGLDDLGVTLERLDDIARFQEAHRVRRPWVYDIHVPGGRP